MVVVHMFWQLIHIAMPKMAIILRELCNFAKAQAGKSEQESIHNETATYSIHI
jgi:hypothetical protein